MRLLSFLLLCVATIALSGCFVVPSLKDPFGAYAASITMNDRNAQARETIARYDRDARMAEAEQAAQAKVDTARAWSGMVPTVALIVAVCVITVVLIYWSGRITLARLAWEIPNQPHSPQLAQPDIGQLKAIAARRHQQFKIVNGVALLIDKDTGEVVKRRLLKG